MNLNIGGTETANKASVEPGYNGQNCFWSRLKFGSVYKCFHNPSIDHQPRVLIVAFQKQSTVLSSDEKKKTVTIRPNENIVTD